MSHLSPVEQRVYGATMAQAVIELHDDCPHTYDAHDDRCVHDMKTVLAQHKRCTETITAEHHGDDVGTYNYLVRIEGGKHDNLEIHCHTVASVLWLFDLVLLARQGGVEWNWLAPLGEL